MTTKVIINPVNKEPVIRYDRVTDKRKGDDGQFYETTVQEHQLTRAPGTRVTVCANPSASRGGALNTGLDVLVDNPYRDGDSEITKDKDNPQWRTHEWEKIFKGKDQVLRQYILEYKHNRPFNFYTNQVDPFGHTKTYLGDSANTIPFFQTSEAQLEMYDGITVLDLKNPLHEVLYWVLVARDDIANSAQELALNPGAKWYISKETEEAEVKLKSRQKRNKAISRLEEINDVGDNSVIKFVKVINDPAFANVKTISKTQAYNMLDSFLQGKPENITEFNFAYNLYNKPESTPEFEARVTIHDCLTNRIMYQRGNTITWLPPRREDGSQPQEISWNRLEEVIDFLTNPANAADQKDLNDQLSARLRL